MVPLCVTVRPSVTCVTHNKQHFCSPKKLGVLTNNNFTGKVMCLQGKVKLFLYSCGNLGLATLQTHQ